MLCVATPPPLRCCRVMRPGGGTVGLKEAKQSKCTLKIDLLAAIDTATHAASYRPSIQSAIDSAAHSSWECITLKGRRATDSQQHQLDRCTSGSSQRCSGICSCIAALHAAPVGRAEAGGGRGVLVTRVQRHPRLLRSGSRVPACRRANRCNGRGGRSCSCCSVAASCWRARSRRRGCASA